MGPKDLRTRNVVPCVCLDGVIWCWCEMVLKTVLAAAFLLHSVFGSALSPLRPFALGMAIFARATTFQKLTWARCVWTKATVGALVSASSPRKVCLAPRRVWNPFWFGQWHALLTRVKSSIFMPHLNLYIIDACEKLVRSNAAVPAAFRWTEEAWPCRCAWPAEWCRWKFPAERLDGFFFTCMTRLFLPLSRLWCWVVDGSFFRLPCCQVQCEGGSGTPAYGDDRPSRAKRSGCMLSAQIPPQRGGAEFPAKKWKVLPRRNGTRRHGHLASFFLRNL